MNEIARKAPGIAGEGARAERELLAAHPTACWWTVILSAAPTRSHSRIDGASMGEQLGRDTQRQRVVHVICNTASAEWCLCGGTSDATYGVAEVNHETGAMPMFMPSVQ